MSKSDDWVYDIEVLPNVFTLKALSCSTGEVKTFEISPRKNDKRKLVQWINWLAVKSHRMVGFNNIHYDYPIVHYIMTVLADDNNAKRLTKNIYNKSKAIFKDSKYPVTKFKHTVWDSDHLVSQIDLFKVHHFDNQARSTSLKRLQFNMRLPSIQEFEIPFDEPIKKGSIIQKLLNYNDYDVVSTKRFYELSKPQVEFREYLESEMDKSFMNDNDTKIGEKYLVDRLKEEVGYDVLYTQDEQGNRKKRITERKVIPVKDILFDYISFKHPELKRVHEWMKELNMFVINGKFHWNEHDEYPSKVGEIKNLKAQVRKVSKENKPPLKEQLDKLQEKYADHRITADMDGFEFEFGKGGLHGTQRGVIKYTDKERLIIDLDVTSYYPSLGIVNNLYPEHLTESFCPIYSSVRDMRKEYPKGSPQNAMLKLALNGTYGKTNSKYSVFYDPKYTIATTVNGQLLLCMLWEWLTEIPNTEILQANTDGITIQIDKTKKAKSAVKKICRKWEKLTGLQLESAVYSRMWIRDGNNYIAEYINGKLKQKGAYLYQSLYHDKDMETDGIEWHKNHSMMVVQKAVEAELVHGIPANKFIIEHKDVYDFFLCTNVNRSCRLFIGDGVVPAVKKSGKMIIPPALGPLNKEIQRNSRYLISNSQDVLTKEMPPLKGQTHNRYIGINVGYNVSVYNDVESDDANDYDINYQFYIDEAEKLLKPFR